ncbi:GTPase Der [Candidatus Portiera aleyrodidarum]|uniref:GTPase Der n=1 Tax=Candidatus Portiera aleyrodidarum TV TaxID=1297582 RepID=A0A8D3XAS7_9GAMM|nr:ribosome biogenesis GTPase Der [Candidatus Portiera aleyrodidarum]AGI27176.1 small GTP-binding protein domain protein [Candidatus Portiera aleyrodidarum TV]CEI59155.1 GTPase Der [Candidatus Portiera aleyrodidarum]
MNLIISIIGKTNVGKSTLFNCLTKNKNSIINNIPYFTRDRKYGILQINNQKIILIDTAAISHKFFYYKKKHITYYINKQTKLAIQESHIILFVITSYTNLDTFYKNFISFLKNKNKKIIFIINKIDYLIKFSCNKLFNFYKPILISALHNININKLLNLIKFNLSKHTTIINNNPSTKICLIGKTNVGKSTLINSLLKENRLIINNRPGTTRENITIKIHYKNHLFLLTDTKGLTHNIKHNKNLFFLIQTNDIIFYVIDAHSGIFEKDIYLLTKIFLLGKHLFLIINKWDAITNKQKLLIRKELTIKLYKYKKFLNIHFISALYFYNINTIFHSIDYFLYFKSKTWSIHFLTKLINLAITNNPPLKKQHLLKFLLAKQININPIIIMIFGHKHIKFLPNNYKKYLFNFLIHKLNIKNILLQIHYFNQ